MSLPPLIRSLGPAITDTDLAALRWITPVRVAAVTAVVVGVLLAVGRPAEALMAGFGAMVAGVADQRGPMEARIKAMAIMTIGTALAVTLGVLVSDLAALRVATTVVLAFACGYMARMGPRSGMVGQVSLVMFIVLAGSPEAADTAAPEGLIVLAGGAVQVAVAAAAQLFTRTGGVRTDIAIAWRAAGYTLRTARLQHGVHSPAVRAKAARADLRAMSAEPEVSGPLEALLDSRERLGMGGVIVLSTPVVDAAPEDAAALERITTTAGDLAIAIGAAVETPARARVVEPALARFEQAVREGAGIRDRSVVTGIREMQIGLRDAVAVIRAGIPRGRGRSVPVSMAHSAEPVRALIGPVTFGDAVLRHAVRLALATGAGTLIALAAGFPHTYWIPMTVAWVMKPDLGSTTARVTARIAGTFAGLLIVAVAIWLLGDGAVVTVAVVFAAILVFTAFLVPNYAVATIGVTMYIVVMLTYLGDPLLTTMDARILGTIIAGGLALGTAAIIPAPVTRALLGSLASFADAVAGYATLVRAGADAPRRGDALALLGECRIASGQLAESARGALHRPAFPPGNADRMVRDLVRATAVLVAADVGAGTAGAVAVPPRVEDDATDLAGRLRALQAGGPVPARALPPLDEPGADAAGAVDDAQQALDAAVAVLSR